MSSTDAGTPMDVPAGQMSLFARNVREMAFHHANMLGR
jgi:hypothetical protein